MKDLGLRTKVDGFKTKKRYRIGWDASQYEDIKVGG
jgi:hypothetical protein